MDGKWQDYSSKKLKKDLLKKASDEPDVPEDRRISGEIPHQRQKGMEYKRDQAFGDQSVGEERHICLEES